MEIEAKVVVLGSQGVGKTSVALRFIHQTFSIDSRPTIGASFLTKKLEVDRTTVKLQIWDTAGQERFRSMGPIYYRGSHAAIIMYDITNKASFEDLQLWLDELKGTLGDSLQTLALYIVGNKYDLASSRQVDQEAAEKFAASVGATYFETSAKENSGISELFTHVGRSLISKNTPKKSSVPILPEDPTPQNQESKCC